MPKLSVIILSFALDDEVYQMNTRCLDSLFTSEQWTDGELEVLLIESNRDAIYQYDARVRIMIPEEKFGFHRFFNIGLDNTAGEFIAFCNNDIVFQPNWWTAIKRIKEQHPKFMCFSPLDRSYPMMTEEEMPSTKDYYIGWENKRHFAAWCFVWERKLLDIIGKFDEVFDFYSADDDELMTLRKYAIPNVLVTDSEVKHLSQVVTIKAGVSKYRVTDKKCFPLSEKEISRGLSWLWDDVRFYNAYRRMETKWGNERMIRRIHRFLDVFPIFRKRWITKMLYNKSVVTTLAKLTGI